MRQWEEIESAVDRYCGFTGDAMPAMIAPRLAKLVMEIVTKYKAEIPDSHE